MRQAAVKQPYAAWFAALADTAAGHMHEYLDDQKHAAMPAIRG